MHKPLRQVQEFHNRFGLFAQDTVRDAPENIRAHRIDLMQEELQEVVGAMHNEPVENIAKELADLIYVVYGTVLSYGLQDKFEDIFDEVQRSNMSKLDKDGNVLLRDDGKVLKSDQYTQADIKTILDKI